MAIAAPEVDIIEYAPGQPPEMPIDPITARVIAGALDGIALEAGHKLMRMSYSSIIRESEDFGIALLDAQGRQIRECALSTPLQLGPIPGYLRGIFQLFNERGDSFEEGDVIIHNSPYHGASHGPDVGFCVPIFARGDLVGFSFATAHHLDIKAMTPGSCGIVEAVDAYAEGLQLKAIKCYERGRRNDMVWRFLRDNIRASDMVVGDMEAQVAACHMGADRYLDLLHKYGRDTVDIAVYVTLRSILLDQATHEHVPQNSGLVRPIRIIAERGSLANPTFPCATIARAAPGNIVCDTLMAALAPICPDRVAAGMGNMTAVAYTGVVEGRHWVYIDITEGSYGGRLGRDGIDAVDVLYANTRNNPIEDIEAHYPIRVTRYELQEDRGGAGRWRGGVGSIRDMQLQTAAHLSLEGDGHRHPPKGAFGGLPGHTGGAYLIREGK